jgi:hypothetical protein
VWSYNLASDYQAIKDKISLGVNKKSAFTRKCVTNGRLNLSNAIK